MREVIPNRLWLGNSRDAADVRRLHDVGIAAVVDLAYEEPAPELPRDLLYCRIPLVDGPDNREEFLMMAVTATAALIRNRIPTLVVCSAGLSRSLAVVAAALAIVRDGPPDVYLAELTGGGPHEVSRSLWTDVVKVCGVLKG